MNKRRGSLLIRLVISHVALALITLIVAGSVLAALLNSYVYRSKLALLTASGSEIARLMNDVAAGRRDPNSAYDTLRALDSVLQARVLIADRGGLILIASQGPPAKGLRIDREAMNQVLAGHTVTFTGQWFGVIALSVVVPIIESGQVTGAVILNAPVSTLTLITASLQQQFIWAALASIALSLLLAYLISRSLSGPLRKLTEAARGIAAGDYTRRVDLPADDELGELAATFNLAAAELQKLEQTRREFIADVSHELRRPLTRLLAAVEAVADGIITDPAELRQHLSDTRAEVARTARLVDDMLQLSRLDSGTFTLARERVDLSGLVSRVCADMAPGAAKEGISLTFAGEPGVFVNADPGRIEQVLANLIENALRFTPAGGHVFLSVSRGDAGARITVSDTGAGIPPEQLPHIWERFYKGDRSRADQGSGLGLAIVRRIVELHGGTVTAASEVGRGTTFTITLPMADTVS